MNQIAALRQAVLNDQVLLHGSPKKINEIHPHYTDDEMAICATPYPEIAIFMAIATACRPGNIGFKTRINSKKCCVEFKICERVLETLLHNEIKGYVYALDAYGFKKRSPFEYRTYESVYSSRSITVTKQNLPFIPIEGQMDYHVVLNPAVAMMFS